MIEWQLAWMHQLQEVCRSPLMDTFFLWWNFVDTATFMILLIPLVALFYRWELALKILGCALFGWVLNLCLKSIFQVPRPFVFDPSIAILEVGGWSFPSGAAQTAIWLPGLFLLYTDYRLKWWGAVSFAFLLSFSRVYLGVHYPLDILGGWIVGGFILALTTVFASTPEH